MEELLRSKAKFVEHTRRGPLVGNGDYGVRPDEGEGNPSKGMVVKKRWSTAG